MKAKKMHMPSLRNDEHYQFMTEFRLLIERYNPQELKIELWFAAFLTLHAQEDEALKKINKSLFTEKIEDADKSRDDIFRGMIDTNKGLLKHFSPGVRDAAKQLKIVFDTYGNLAPKPLNEQTSAVYNLVQDLNGRYAPDVTTAGIKMWVDELETSNNTVADLVRDRFEEAELRTDIVLRQKRGEVDEAYRAVIARVEAFAVVDDNAALFLEFIRSLNIVIDKYNDILAQRKGRNKKS
jgi:hypothetical protein